MDHSHEQNQPSRFEELSKTCNFKLEKCLMIVTLVLFCFVFIPILVLDIIRYSEPNFIENGTQTTTHSETTDSDVISTTASFDDPYSIAPFEFHSSELTATPFHKTHVRVTESFCNMIGSGNIVSCNGYHVNDVVQKTNEYVLAQQLKTIDLRLIDFPEYTISQGWLDKLNCKVNKLTISSDNLNYMGEAIFSNHPFSENTEIIITNSEISYLKQSTFDGAKISSFQMRSEPKRELVLDEDLFKYTANYLKIFQFSGFIFRAEDIQNLTGKGSYLNELKTLVLENNIISKIARNSFAKAPAVLQIFLMRCSIESIEKGAFDGAYSLQQIDLEFNNLKTLPEGLLTDQTSLHQIYINKNQWICDCNLLWLKTFLIRKNMTGHENDECVLSDGSSKKFLEVDFCPSDSSVTPTSLSDSTTDSTTPSSTPKGKGKYLFKQLLCKEATNVNLDIKKTKKAFLQSAVLKTRDHYVAIDFYQNENTPTYTFDVHSSNGQGELEFLVWTNVDNGSDYECAYNFSHAVINVNAELSYDTIYTVCLATNDTEEPEYIVSRDCTAIKTPTQYSNQAWLTNKEKKVVISSFIVALLFSVLVASFVMYLIVRQHPQLIKGNKRVVIVKQKRKVPSFLIMPNYESMVAKSDGYLTPKSRRYSKIKSAYESKQIYDFYDDVKTNNIFTSESFKTTFEDNIYEAPPLPPNHPCEKRLSKY